MKIFRKMKIIFIALNRYNFFPHNAISTQWDNSLLDNADISQAAFFQKPSRVKFCLHYSINDPLQKKLVESSEVLLPDNDL
jgi:hypothetical protein